ncbi:hypothetical protein AMECASPLE_011517 [Ameca splendens]|uniref:Uncharacterized protein n=1 Tax=Ameca splendens TaxID=208324 RepID=A0ABV0ZBJ4_9TELE
MRPLTDANVFGEMSTVYSSAAIIMSLYPSTLLSHGPEGLIILQGSSLPSGELQVGATLDWPFPRIQSGATPTPSINDSPSHFSCDSGQTLCLISFLRPLNP